MAHLTIYHYDSHDLPCFITIPIVTCLSSIHCINGGLWKYEISPNVLSYGGKNADPIYWKRRIDGSYTTHTPILTSKKSISSNGPSHPNSVFALVVPGISPSLASHLSPIFFGGADLRLIATRAGPVKNGRGSYSQPLWGLEDLIIHVVLCNLNCTPHFSDFCLSFSHFFGKEWIIYYFTISSFPI